MAQARGYAMARHRLALVRLNKLPYTMYWKSIFNFMYVGPYALYIPKEKWLNYSKLIRRHILRRLTPHSAASEMGLHCLPVTLLGVSILK